LRARRVSPGVLAQRLLARPLHPALDARTLRGGEPAGLGARAGVESLRARPPLAPLAARTRSRRTRSRRRPLVPRAPDVRSRRPRTSVEQRGGETRPFCVAGLSSADANAPRAPRAVAARLPQDVHRAG